MSQGIRRTLLGLLAGAALLVLVGVYEAVPRHLLPFGVLMFVLAVPFLIVALRIVLRLRSGDMGTKLAAAPWSGQDPALLVSRPLRSADDLLRRYVVVLDGKRVAALGYGDAVELAVREGQHAIQAELGGSDKRSGLLRLACEPGLRQIVLVEPSSYAMRKLADEWILVHQEE